MTQSADSLNIMYRQLISLQPLSEEEWLSFNSIWIPVNYKRKVVLTAAGETEKYLYWVTEGVQRGFHLHEQKEATIVFTYPCSFSGILASFLLQQPSRFFLETLTSSGFLRTSFQQVEQQRKHILPLLKSCISHFVMLLPTYLKGRLN
jgi:hypothetical protein